MFVCEYWVPSYVYFYHCLLLLLGVTSVGSSRMLTFMANLRLVRLGFVSETLNVECSLFIHV